MLELSSVARQLSAAQSLPQLLSLCHWTCCAMTIKSELGSAGALYFSRKNPLACWLSNVSSMFAGAILSNFLLNEPIISSFVNTRQVLIATLVWYLIYYSPFDCIYKLTELLPVKLAISSLSEVDGILSTHAGVKYAAKIYPNSFAVMLVIGTVRGNGFALFRVLEALTRGAWNLSLLSEIVRPNYSTKLGMISATLIIGNEVSFFYALPAPLASLLLSAVALVAPNSTFLEYYYNYSSIVNNVSSADASMQPNNPTVYDYATHSAATAAAAAASTACFSFNNDAIDNELYLFVPRDLLILCIVIVAVYLRACAILLNVTNPFAPIERLISLLVFGGIWDALSRAISIDERISDSR